MKCFNTCKLSEKKCNERRVTNQMMYRNSFLIIDLCKIKDAVEASLRLKVLYLTDQQKCHCYQKLKKGNFVSSKHKKSFKIMLKSSHFLMAFQDHSISSSLNVLCRYVCSCRSRR